MSMSNSVEELLKRKKEIENDGEDTFQCDPPPDLGLPEGIDLPLLGVVWNVFRDYRASKEIITLRHFLSNELIVEQGKNSFWIYGFESSVEESIKIFNNHFSGQLKKYSFIRPESESETFLFYYFKDALKCRLNILASSLSHEAEKHRSILLDSINDYKNEINGMDDLNKFYSKQWLNKWISEKLLKNTHLAL